MNKIHIDTDRYFNSEVGTISILAEDLPQMETLLAEHGIERSPHSDDFITSFTLPKPLTPEEVKSFFAREQGARDKVNEILRGENLEQFLDAEMRKTISILYHITRKMDDHRRWFVGQSMTETILDLYMLKNQMERKTLEKVVAAEEMREQIDRLMTYTNVLLEMRILDVHKVEGLAKHHQHDAIRDLFAAKHSGSRLCDPQPHLRAQPRDRFYQPRPGDTGDFCRAFSRPSGASLHLRQDHRLVDGEIHQKHLFLPQGARDSGGRLSWTTRCGRRIFGIIRKIGGIYQNPRAC